MFDMKEHNVGKRVKVVADLDDQFQKTGTIREVSNWEILGLTVPVHYVTMDNDEEMLFLYGQLKGI